jgi:hypothetical protein
MKTIVALVALTCLLGIAGAQTQSMIGEGYSTTQLGFYHSPITSTFEPNVEQYWGSYITGSLNTSQKDKSSNTDIWMNTFPLNFDAPLKLTTTSFSANATGLSMSSTEMNSQFLTRDVMSKFGINHVWSYPQTNGSVIAYGSSGTPSDESKGKIITQNIASLFNV